MSHFLIRRVDIDRLRTFAENLPMHRIVDLFLAQLMLHEKYGHPGDYKAFRECMEKLSMETLTALDRGNQVPESEI